MLQEVTKTKAAPQVLEAALPRPSVKQTTADWFHENVVRGRKEVFCEIVTLTPDLARFLLAANTSNRVVKTSVLETYKQDIAGGRWALNGESIKIARDGSLIDGQHRCWAVVETDKPIKTLVMFGIDRGSRMTIDQGAGRTASDYLAMEGGVKYVTVAAGVARALYIMSKGLPDRAAYRDGVTRMAVRAEYWANQKDIDAACSFCLSESNVSRAAGGPVAVVTALVLTRRVHASADDFIRQLITGEELQRGSPILAARNKFVAGRIMSVVEKVRIMLHAFDAWREDRPLQIVRLPGSNKKKAGRK